MARKVVSRKAKRDEADAAAAAGLTDEAPKKKKKKATKRKSRAKAAVDAPKRLYWGVFNQSLKCVAKYEFNQKKHAAKKAEELNKKIASLRNEGQRRDHS